MARSIQRTFLRRARPERSTTRCRSSRRTFRCAGRCAVLAGNLSTGQGVPERGAVSTDELKQPEPNLPNAETQNLPDAGGFPNERSRRSVRPFQTPRRSQASRRSARILRALKRSLASRRSARVSQPPSRSRVSRRSAAISEPPSRSRVLRRSAATFQALGPAP